MPTLFRFLMIVAVVVVAVYAVMIALVTFVQPQEHEISQTIPASRFK